MASSSARPVACTSGRALTPTTGETGLTRKTATGPAVKMGPVDTGLPITHASSSRRPQADITGVVPRVLAVLLASAIAAWTTHTVVTSGWWTRPYDKVTSTLAIAPAWLCPAAAAVLWWWRPTSVPARLLYAIGLLWAVWIGMGASGDPLQAWGVLLIIPIRPLVYWLIVAWPTGHLGTTARRLISLYAVLEFAGWGLPLLFTASIGTDWSVSNPIALADIPEVGGIGGEFVYSVLLPASAIVVLVALVERSRALPTAGRRVIRPALVASAIFAVGDIVLFVIQFVDAQLRNESGQLNLTGVMLFSIDWLRFGILPILFVVSAWRRRRAAGATTRIRTIALDTTGRPPRLAGTIKAALGDATARVGYYDQGDWLDSGGRRIELGGPGRTVFVVERGDKPVAAVEHATEAGVRPSAVTAAVSAAAFTVDVERLAALAKSRRDTALAARRAVVEAADDARLRIQRDLHDGAQQRLVGLALHVQLAGQNDVVGDQDCVATEIREEIDRAAKDLRDLVEGQRYAIEGRSLEQALTELIATLPLPVILDARLPVDPPDAVKAAAWFAASEATTNVIKYASASRVSIATEISHGRLHLEVSDDGVGGAMSTVGGGLAGLRDRIERLGGDWSLLSPAGLGTTMSVDIPIGTAP